MDFPKLLGVYTKRISNLYARRIFEVKGRIPEMKGVTAMQGLVAGYLTENSDRDIFQKDVEAELDIRSSSASNLLQRMEKNGLIIRTPVPGDTRWKKIELTEKAEDLKKKIHKELLIIEKKALKGFTKEDKDMLFLLLNKAIKNLSQ